MVQTGFIGYFLHNLDEKGRVSIPAKFKKIIDDGVSSEADKNKVVLTTENNNCIAVIPIQRWGEMITKFMEGKDWEGSEEDRKKTRQKTANAVEVNIDKSGRIIIPQNLKKHAGISKSVVFSGVMDRFEIWDKKKYEEYQKS